MQICGSVDFCRSASLQKYRFVKVQIAEVQVCNVQFLKSAQV